VEGTPVGVDGAVLEVEVEDDVEVPGVELEDDGAVPVAPADVLVLFPEAEEGEVEPEAPAEAPADVGVELEPGALAADEESGAELVAVCELPAVDALPLLVFPPQPNTAVNPANKSEPPMSKERRCIKTSQK
jgi:hypothetical protein